MPEGCAVSPQASDGTRQAELLSQLHVLSDFIENLRREVASTQADDIVGRHLPAASDELDAIVLHTAEATGLILDECEILEQAVDGDAFRAVVTGSTARIYEACSFQDITGQRVAKIVHTLKVIEAKVGEMVRVFSSTRPVETVPELPTALLNGPQRSGVAMQQHDIDALLDSFE